MSNNNNLSVLPFYTDIEEQFHRLPYSYGAIYPLITPLGTVLPFQIQRAHAASQPVTEVKLITADGTEYDITQAMSDTGLQVVEFAAYDTDVIVYNAVLPLTLPANVRVVGLHSLQITDGVNTWYSDFFTWTDDTSGLLRIQWYDEENLMTDAGIIVYDNPRFINSLYFCTDVGKPEYQFTDEGEERDGYYFLVKQISEKTYKAVTVAPEYLCDVMRLIRMADHIRVTDRFGRIYDCDTFEIDVKWEEQGDLASVVMTWQTDTVVKKVGVAYVRRNEGEFNIDMNDDFDN